MHEPGAFPLEVSKLFLQFRASPRGGESVTWFASAWQMEEALHHRGYAALVAEVGGG